MEIPEFLKHLEVDEKRGYVIPYFVGYVKGIPDFRLLDPKKQMKCFREELCGVCGKKLIPPFAYCITGPLGLKNNVSQDPLMHEECAEYSLKVCPHLHLEKARRRETGDYYKQAMKNDKAMVKEKPTSLYLIRAAFWDYEYIQGGYYITYKPLAAKRFVYENGILVEYFEKK